MLGYGSEPLLANVIQHSKQLLQRQRAKGQLHHLDRARLVGLAADVSSAVSSLGLQQLAGEARELVASSGVSPDVKLSAVALGMLLELHAWLVQHQLLDGQVLAGMLSDQQLAEGQAAAASAAYAAYQQALKGLQQGTAE
jgi:hypothetical protein